MGAMIFSELTMKLLLTTVLVVIVGCGLRGHRPVGQDADAVAALERLGAELRWNSRGELLDGYLRLDGTQITDADLVHLRGLSNLQWLSLGGTRISDAGLVHLQELTRLRWVGLRYTRVTPAGIAQLKKKLPNCQVHHEPRQVKTGQRH